MNFDNSGGISLLVRSPVVRTATDEAFQSDV